MIRTGLHTDRRGECFAEYGGIDTVIANECRFVSTTSILWSVTVSFFLNALRLKMQGLNISKSRPECNGAK